MPLQPLANEGLFFLSSRGFEGRHIFTEQSIKEIRAPTTTNLPQTDCPSSSHALKPPEPNKPELTIYHHGHLIPPFSKSVSPHRRNQLISPCHRLVLGIYCFMHPPADATSSVRTAQVGAVRQAGGEPYPTRPVSSMQKGYLQYGVTENTSMRSIHRSRSPEPITIFSPVSALQSNHRNNHTTPRPSVFHSDITFGLNEGDT